LQVALIAFLSATCNHMTMTDETKYPSQLAERFQIRLPDGMRDRLRIEAEKSGRSMNTEIITRLEASLAGAVGGGTVDQIFSGTLQQLMSRETPPSAAQLRHLTSKYEEFRQFEVQQLREFLDAVADMWREEDLLGLSYEERYRRAVENEIAELRARAQRMGYDLIDKSGERLSRD